MWTTCSTTFAACTGGEPGTGLAALAAIGVETAGCARRGQAPRGRRPGPSRVAALSYPAERQAGRIVGEGPDAVPELLRLLRTEAKVL